MKKEILKDMLVELIDTKEVFETIFEELMDKVVEVADFVGVLEPSEIEAITEEVVPAPAQTMQDRFNQILKAKSIVNTVDTKDLVSQLQEQLRQVVEVEEPAEEIVNESEETTVSATPLVEVLRSQLTTSDSEQDEEINDCDEEDYEEIDEASETNDADSISTLAQSLREQIALPDLSELPRPEELQVDIHTPTTDFPNFSEGTIVEEAKPSLAEQLRQQINTSNTEGAAEVVEAEDTTPSLTMEQMIQQLRNDINIASTVEDEKEEEELVSAAASTSDQDVAQSLRHQLLVQELKKQLN